MRITTLLVAVTIVLGLAHTRRAEACGGGAPVDGGVIAVVVVGVGAYAGTTLAMGIKDIASDDHSKGYGVAEVAFNAPFTLLFGTAMIGSIANDNPYGDSGFNTTAAVFTAIHGGLLAHGIYTLAKPRKRSEKKPGAPIQHYGPPGAMQVGPVTAVVSPAPIQNGAGVGLSGTF